MQLTFASRVAAPARDCITQMLSRLTYPLGLTEWSFVVHLKRFPADREAEVVVEPAGHSVRLYLSRALLPDDRALQRVLIHELTHVLTWGAWLALADLAAHVPAEQRRTCRTAAERAYEQANDAVALVLNRVLIP